MYRWQRLPPNCSSRSSPRGRRRRPLSSQRIYRFPNGHRSFTNARLCKAVLDRLTDQAHIIETGTESYRVPFQFRN